MFWKDHLLNRFHQAQQALKSVKTVSLPRPTDQLIIVHDGARTGIGSVLYLQRNGQLKLGGFFSAKLKSHQAMWCPCELESLSIASSFQHFGTYLRQSLHRSQVLADSKPCVQAWSKMKRGEFSTISRVATFISILSQFHIDVQHIAGK